MPNAIVAVLVFILLMPLCSEAFERSELSISDPSHMLYIFDTPTAYFLKEGETTFILASSMPVLSSFFSRWTWHVNESVMGLGNLGLELRREPDSVLAKPQESSMFLYLHGFFGGRTKLLNTDHFCISTEEGIAGLYTNSNVSPSSYYISLYLTPILSVKVRSIGIHLNFRYEHKYICRRIPAETEDGVDSCEAGFESEFDNPGIGVNCKLSQSTALLLEGRYQDNYTNLALGVMIYKDLLRVKIGCEVSISEYDFADFRQLLCLRGPM